MSPDPVTLAAAAGADTWAKLASALITAVGGGLAWAISLLVSINHKVNQQNGRVGKIETQLADHVSNSDRERSAIWDSISEIRQGCIAALREGLHRRERDG